MKKKTKQMIDIYEKKVKRWVKINLNDEKNENH